MTMTMRTTTATPTRPPKPERGARRYTILPDPPKKIDMAQHKHIVRAHSILEDRYADDPTTLVFGEGYLLLTAGDRRCYVVPDCLIAFGVEAEELDESSGYVISEVGKPPDFVLEIASESTGERDYTVKRRIYRNMGTVEYWRFDPSGGRYHDAPLAGDILVDGEYHPIEIRREPDGTHWGYSAALGLFLVWEEGKLRFYDPAVSDFLSNITEHRRAREAERAARIESDRRAASANRRAANANRRADRAERGREEERAARIASNRRAASANRRAAEAEAEARANARRVESERAARMDAEAELERLRRLLGDLE